MPSVHGAPTAGAAPAPRWSCKTSPVFLKFIFSLLPQKGDLACMYRLFNRLPKGLEPMAEIFRKHVEEEGEPGPPRAAQAAGLPWTARQGTVHDCQKI